MKFGHRRTKPAEPLGDVLQRGEVVPHVGRVEAGHHHAALALPVLAVGAEEAGLDLVEVSPNADPPVCKIMDYGKYIYQKDKQQQAAKKKQKQIQVKEVKFRPTTEEGDFQTKLKHCKEFLEEGDKVKIVIRYKGRELAHQDLGFKLIDRLKAELDELALVEQHPKLEGKQAIMVMGPRKH